METIALVATIVCLVLNYGFLWCAKWKDSFVVVAILTFSCLTAVGTSLAATALFGTHTKDGFPKIPQEFETELGWSYYVACVGAGVLILTVIATSRSLCLLQSQRRQDEYRQY